MYCVAYLYSADSASCILPTVHPIFCPLCSLPIFCPPCILYSPTVHPFLFLNSPIFVFCPSVSICYAWQCLLFSGHCIHPLLPIPPLHPLFCTFLQAVHSPLCSLLPLLTHCASYTLLHTAIETSCDGMRVVKVSCPSLQNICRLIASYRSHPCLYTVHLIWPCVRTLDSAYLLFLTTRNKKFSIRITE